MTERLSLHFISFHCTSLTASERKSGWDRPVFYCLVAQSCLTHCYCMDCKPPGSSVQGIFQARILEWVTISGDLPDPGIEPMSPALAGGFFTTNATWEAQEAVWGTIK